MLDAQTLMDTLSLDVGSKNRDRHIRVHGDPCGLILHDDCAIDRNRCETARAVVECDEYGLRFVVESTA